MAPPHIRMPSPLSANRGFTLIEILIAMTIFSIGILAIGTIQITATKTIAIARDVTEKSILAKDIIEHLMTLSYNDPALTAGEHSLSAGNLTQDNDSIDNDNDGRVDENEETGFITVSWNVQNQKPIPNTKTIEVTVDRNTALAGKRKVTLTFIKGKL
jgi:type IV pilus assembly protein PilV